MKKQYMVQEHGADKRWDFYNYIHDNYNFEEHFFDLRSEIEDTNFPFVVDFKTNLFWMCNSITCCACAAQKNKIISVLEFKNEMKQKTRKK